MPRGVGTGVAQRPGMSAETGPLAGQAPAPPERARARRLRLERAFALLVAIGGAVAIVTAGYRLRDTYVGDAAVYLPYAHNAGNLDFFQFNPGEFSSGSTSPLWSVLLGIPFAFGLGLSAAKAFATGFALVGFATLLYVARRLSGSLAAAAVASLLALGTMTLFAASLYESGLVVAVAALALLAGDRAQRRWRAEARIAPRSLVPLSGVWAALLLARPDAVILAGAQAVALLAFAPLPRRRLALGLLAALAVAALPAAAYYGYSVAELGTFSTSSQGRSEALREGLDKWLGPLYLNGAAARKLFASPWVFALVPAAVGLALAARTRSTRWLAGYGFLAVAGYVSLLTFVTPGYYDTERYLVPLVPILVVGAALLIARASNTVLWLPALAAGLLAIGVPSALELRDYQRLARSLGIDEHEVFERDVGALINRIAARGDEVLSYEVQMRYFLRNDVDILSEDGITDGKVAPYQRSGDITAFLMRYRPRWWIADNNVRTRRFLQASALHRALETFEADPGAKRRSIDGIRFELVARRTRPLAPGFGGWLMLFELKYPAR